MSGNVGSAISESGILENMGGSLWNRITSSFRSNVISTSGLNFRRSDQKFEFRVSADVGPCCPCHVYVGHGRKNLGVAVGTASPLLPFNGISLLVSTSGV